MWQSKPTWILSILVLIASCFSLLVINNKVLAAWYYPDANPPNTGLNNSFVFNPVTESLNLDGNDILNVGNLCLASDCRNTWPAGGGGGSDANWSINGASNNDLYYVTSSPASGEVGIGTNTPTTKFHIYDASNGPIITLSGLNTNYRGLTIKDTSNNEQWFYGPNNTNSFVIRRSGTTNHLTIDPTSGNIGIGSAVDASYRLYTVANASPFAIGGQNNMVGGVGVMGLGNLGGVVALGGSYGISAAATAAGGSGITANKGAGIYAGYFDGELRIVNGYLRVNSTSAAPAGSDCSASYYGRVHFDHRAGILYICSEGIPPVWKKVTLTP